MTEETAESTEQAGKAPSEVAELQPAAHGRGICEVLHLAADGSQLLTTGADGRLACLEAETSEAPEGRKALSRSWAQKISKGLGATTAAISSDLRLLAVSEETESGFQAWVHLLDAKGRVTRDQKPRNAGRFTLDIRQLSWHSTLPYLCIATDDGKVDIWCDGDSSGGPSRKQVFRGGGASGGVRCACLDPKAERVAAAFSSGELVIQDFESSSEKHRAKLWPKSVLGSDRLLMAWDPSGEHLALPGEPTLRLLAADFSMVHLEGGHRFGTTMASWSPSGHVLVSASAEAVAVWSQNSLRRVISFNVEPSSLTWGGPDSVAVGTQAGYFACIQVLLEEPAAVEAERLPEPSAEPEPESQADDAKEDSQESGAAASSQLPEQEQEFAAPVVQKSFQPGATLKGRRRFLAWNDCGSLKLMLPSARPGARGTQAHAAVEVDYYRRRDPACLRSIRIEERVELGAIGPNLCALASNACANSTIVVHMGSPWQQASFRHALASHERTEALALGSNFLAVFVSPGRFLRLFSPSFVPIGVLSIPGGVVSMVAREDLLLVVYQRKQRREPNLHFMILDVARKEKLECGPLPLSPSSTLKWIGFSAEAQPLALDSQGTLRLLLRNQGQEVAGFVAGSWIPAAELGPGGGLWPVQAADGNLNCVELASGQEPKAGSPYRFKAVPFRLPLDGLAGDFLRQGLLAAQAPQASAVPGGLRQPKRPGSRDSALKLLQSFQQSNEQELAMDVAAHFLARESCRAKDLEAAAASASAANLPQLAALLSELARRTKASTGEPAPKSRRLG